MGAKHLTRGYFTRMYSDERNGHGGTYQRHSPTPTEDTLHRLQMVSEGKTIAVALQANWRGFFIRITVEENGWRSSVIVPHSMAAEFRECVDTATNGGSDAKGMIETEGKVIFVRTDEGDLLMGEKNSKRNGAVIIHRAAVDEFKKLLDDVLKSPIPDANPRDDLLGVPWVGILIGSYYLLKTVL